MQKCVEQSSPSSCWNKAAPDEYVFVLLGRDRASAETVRFWARERVRIGKNKNTDPEIVESLEWADAVDSKG